MGAARPRIGISSCLLGQEVRYDGTHRRRGELLDAFGGLVEWVPVCPEVEVGMGTPREPIRLELWPGGVASGSHRVRLVGVGTAEDWTGRMHAWARTRVRALDALRLSGYVFKARSPSCGVEGVPVFGAGGPAGAGRGLFAQALIEAVPDLPIADEEQLSDDRAREAFLERILAYRR